MKNWTLALALGAAATTTMIGFGVNPASALTFNVTFDIDFPSAANPTPVNATLITDDFLTTESGFTGYRVTSITGTQGTEPITALVPKGTGSTTLLTSGLTNDNLFNPANIVPVGGVGAFSAGGLAYIEDGEEYRLLYDQGTYMGCLTPCVPVKNLKLVPEPSSTAGLLAIGSFGALGAASTLKRKLKSSKTSENETTKVG
ncbi:MAG: PEP-CTERM sorting domain-containing protein [Burkholderiales bacterium]|jgi:hypothetical protein|uniref:PEP-CTERM sorting domain-containing protein n=1 Tax=Microcystis aeruginosa Ma_QC_C_20070703_M131 TaxID=2486263 RepID=A0A551Y256_MICAE|nr:PEP-CTERM sorting domain-containing protein [Burkholderiales bacterium]TRT55047.1 MAG: PEP-CTERM sorting domain-containing protein [Microcystis aeruginosa Ma_QC_C_20070703_M131]